METLQDRNQDLWKVAKKRVAFKRHLGTYIIINTMFWLLWLFTDSHNHFPWPVWPMIGWGIGLAFNYMDAYVMKSDSAIQKEYDKLNGKS